VEVVDPKGAVVATETTGAGKFVFTTQARADGEYQACFSVKGAGGANQVSAGRVTLDWKTGVAAKDWGVIAKKEHMDEIAVEARKLSELVDEIHRDMIALVRRERAMRDLSEATNSRIKWLSLLCLTVCLGLGVSQIFYLKQFFKRKKIL